MESIANTLINWGTAAVDLLWLPIGLWTVVALCAIGILRCFENQMASTYQYHGRVAVLWGLAAGLLGSLALYMIPTESATGSSIATKFIVIQNPITVSASTPSAEAAMWSDPYLWAGLASILVLVLAGAALLKLVVDFSALKLFSQRISRLQVSESSDLSAKNLSLMQEQGPVKLYFSDQIAVPFTYGWMKKHIVLPQSLRSDTEKLNMALRHELMHIANGDYLLNASVKTIKALFCFHPLVHLLADNIEEHREMYCDHYVLQDTDISPKRYASLLLELSPKPVFKPAAAVNMAVRPSTLKKRINAMTQTTNSMPSLKWSVSLMLVLTLMLTGLMACSDMESNGITRSEVEDVQSNMDKAPSGEEPLYVINGEIDNQENALSRIKPKYINSIEVLKDSSATAQYGQRGQNGVIIMDVDEAAFDDLRTAAEMEAMKEKRKNGGNSADKKVFVAVEQEPQLIGGIRNLQQHVEYPERCKQAGIEGRVFLNFIVDKQGNVENVEVMRGIGQACDQAAVEAVKNHAKFEPARQRGKPVNVQYSLSLLFRLSDSENGSVDDTQMESSNTDGLEIKNLNFSDGEITGTVYDKQTGEPVSAANVLIPSIQRGAATNAQGQFIISNIDKEDIDLRVSHVSYGNITVDV